MTRIEEIEARKAEIRELMNAETAEADLDALTEEVRAINAEAAEIRETAAKADELRTLVANGAGETVETAEITERKETETMEIRNTSEYINAYANYIKTGRDDECRALLTENATGVVPVPDIVDEYVRTAWENDDIVRRIRKTYMKGNVKVGFEISATGAVLHDEGDEAPAEETLVLGIVTLVPESIKKWITISDEAIDLGGEEFIRYIYDELTHQIAKKMADVVVNDIVASPAVSSNTAPAVPVVVASTPTLGTVAEALAKLSDRATDPVIIMNRNTYAAFKALQYSANYPVDPFEGLPVLFNNTLADIVVESNVYMIVGDLGNGYLANFPGGEDIKIKYDDLSLSESDLVKIVGRMFVGHGVVAPNAFVSVMSSGK